MLLCSQCTTRILSGSHTWRIPAVIPHTRPSRPGAPVPSPSPQGTCFPWLCSSPWGIRSRASRLISRTLRCSRSPGLPVHIPAPRCSRSPPSPSTSRTPGAVPTRTGPAALERGRHRAALTSPPVPPLSAPRRRSAPRGARPLPVEAVPRPPGPPRICSRPRSPVPPTPCAYHSVEAREGRAWSPP